jgi:hypothetical protein
MVPTVGGFARFEALDGSAKRADLEAAAIARALAACTNNASPDDQLLHLLERSFQVALLDALSRIPKASAPPPTPATSKAPIPASTPPSASVNAPSPESETSGEAKAAVGSASEEDLIRAAASQAAIDPRFLHALRRAENGGPGREFGVLSVPAPTYQDQARLAAQSIRRSVERFDAQGRSAIDPVTGRYTEEFIKFFSSRYAPIGAGNDPAGLNRFHARNLIRLYAQLSPKDS